MSWLHRRDDAAIEQRIRAALDAIPEVLRNESLSVELIQWIGDDGTAVLRFHGDCPDCEMTAKTFVHGVEAHVRLKVPEIREVRVSDEVRS
ncbi:MAG: NifU family protein [Gemmatimonadota bacterium]|nr:NifU family protein [Gemmatimonadota bacterium]